MSEFILKSLEVHNFRSIRGRIHAPLDAKVVLVHGKNGAGKTSLLSAVELALTGGVQSFKRADPEYQLQLMHRLSEEGSVTLLAQNGIEEECYKSVLNINGAETLASLDKRRANFFQERVFLPQSLLSRLLQIYQESGSDTESPLAKFVTGLLGLDRLDALELGLQPLADIRNVRKITDGWQKVENDKTILDRQLSENIKTRKVQHKQVTETLNLLNEICIKLDLNLEIKEENLAYTKEKLTSKKNSEELARVLDQQRKLAAIIREIEAAQGENQMATGTSSDAANKASLAYKKWEGNFGESINKLRRRIETLLPDTTLTSDPDVLAVEGLSNLIIKQKQTLELVSGARADIKRHTEAQDELEATLNKITIVDEEISRLPNQSGSLGAVLSEITAFIEDDLCPLCERDFKEIGQIPLNEHVHRKVRTLSASAERLLTLGRTRSETQTKAAELKREIEVIANRKLDQKSVAGLDRQLASISNTISELKLLAGQLKEGGRLRALAIAAQRNISAQKSREITISSAFQTLNDFANTIGLDAFAESVSFESATSHLNALLSEKSKRLAERVSLCSQGVELIRKMEEAIELRNASDKSTSSIKFSVKKVEKALLKAQVLRDKGNVLRNAVDEVRSAIIRREFNERLNHLWRDLFVRLAPGEPFVPAFKIPESATRRLQPKLITQHRNGGNAGGTPGAMLSAGNLNTAALTLFTALHLSMSVELPWLILDDPVQSMDDIHIAHFAALLRTISKEHGRQIIIAVHDRQLFEYLTLELSPAFVEDSLLTIELSRGARRDTVCVSNRYSFKEETAIMAMSA